ncbi:MAG: TAXI family TRAP transporter solute-binding subunit, partial [Albidovulum sp.]
ASQRLRQRRELAVILLPAIILAVGALWLAYQFVEPAPPGSVIMTTGSSKGAYHANGQKYAGILKRVGIELVLKTSNGSKENASRLLDPSSGVKVGLIQGGILSAKDAPGLVSLGQVYQEPLWIFYRGETNKRRLTEFINLKLAIGPEGSGTRPLVTALLEANDVTAANAQLLGPETEDAANKLQAGEIDAMFFSSGAESPVVQRLLADKSIKLMSLDQAEAYTRRFPYLAKATLPAGFVSLSQNVPPEDVVMLAPQASLVAREDLHPAIVGLLVDAVKETHSAGGLFERPGEFPKARDPGIPMSDDAMRVYSSGKNFLHRHLPFWGATFIERMLVMMLPVATILLPLMKIVPWLYQWRIRSRINHWYGELKSLEHDMARDRSAGAKMTYRDRLARIEDAVGVIPVPLYFSDQLYMLKASVLLVRQRIAGHGL